LFIRKADATGTHLAAAAQHDARHHLNAEAESDDLAYEQNLPALLGGDLEIAQSSMSEIFDPFFGDFGFNIEQQYM
jgi:hypothetical protein